MQLIRQLKAVQRVLRDNDDVGPVINSGGCCVYAAHITSRLARLGVPAWGVVAHDYYRPVRNADELRLKHRPKNMTDWNDCGLYFHHVLTRFVFAGRIWTHDSESLVDSVSGRDPTYRYKLCEGAFSSAELKTLAACDGWNPMFPREEGTTAIRKAIAKHLTPKALLQ